MKDSRKGKKKMPFSPDVLDALLKQHAGPDGLPTQETMFGATGLIEELTKALVERALQGEMTHHLGYEKHDVAGHNSGNSRNGTTPKTVRSKRGQMRIEVPRDRTGEFEPLMIPKGLRRFDGFDDRVLSLYARGLSVRDIQAHLEDIYATPVSPELISTVTDAVLDEVRIWQARLLDPIYPIVYLDALVVKVKTDGRVANRAIYLAIGVNVHGCKEVLGLWAAQTEGAKFWLSVVTELKNRGVQDIFVACVDGLKGFPEAIETVFPQTQVQCCLVHLVRHSLAFVSYKDRKEVVADLKTIYRAATEAEAAQQLEFFTEKWKGRYPAIAASWHANWARLIPMFGYPPEIRKVIYTTNAIESLNMSLRKVIKTRSSFPNEDAVFKLLYLALQNIQKKWTMPIHDWGRALNAFVIVLGDRMPKSLFDPFTQKS